MPDVRLIDANAVVTIQVFDEMTEEYSMETMTVAKAIDRWADEGCPPAIDAVQVVRCRDCKHRDNPDVCPMIFMRGEMDWGKGTVSYTIANNASDDDFCSKGAKMDAKEDKSCE